MTPARLFRALIRVGNAGRLPGLRRALSRHGYDLLSLSWRDPAWHFMNFGYLDAGEAVRARDQAFVGLYRATIGPLPLAGARILEVGSGRGGGAAWLARQPGVAEVTGVDLSPRTVARARRLHPDVPGLHFARGDAEALPFPDGAFDGVVNVESSHCYGSMPRFLSEVRRVLRPGGWFAWADMRGRRTVPLLDAAFGASGLVIEAEEDLTAGALRALDAMEARKDRSLPRFRPAARLMREFGGMSGSLLRDGLETRRVLYLARRCRKPFTPAAP